MTPAEAFALLAAADMQFFSKSDWDAFAGAESAEPMIGYSGDWTIVLDGACLEVIGTDGNIYQFELVAR